jgi:multiple sugar transport system ATP-binding protein
VSDLELRNVNKEFPGVKALDNVSFEVKNGEFFVLLGPTGAGKTTTLRCIAGLTKPDGGSIFFDSEPVDDLTPADRDVAFVFQQYSLYPTMSVYDNLAFPLRSPMRNVDEENIRVQIEQTAEILQITSLLERKCAHLSGGEMQRVSLGRAIVRDPRIYLMDEPLSNLDAKLRESLRVELQHIQKTQDSTTLFVTHDQIEALTMADRIAVLNKGRIIQIGTPDDIYDRPATTFVAELVGTPRINLVTAARENGNLLVKDSKLMLSLPDGWDPPSDFLLGIRPEDVKLNPEGEFAGELTLLEPLGVETILHLTSGEQTLLSLIPGMTEFRIGENIKFDINQERLYCFDDKGISLLC